MIPHVLAAGSIELFNVKTQLSVKVRSNLMHIPCRSCTVGRPLLAQAGKPS